MKPWYEEMFENSAQEYDRDLKEWYEKLSENARDKPDKEPHIGGTEAEVDFIEREIAFDKSAAILDVGCGTGRHSIELAKRGYIVTGIDLSAAQLDRARKKAAAADVTVHFVQADALNLGYRSQFDAVIVIGAAFGLLETDEKNFEILENVSGALRPRGVLILVTTNGLFPLFHSVKDFINEFYGHDVIKSSTFDLMTFRDRAEYEHVDDDGNVRLLTCDERYYVPSEITWLLKTAGFTEIEIYAAELGGRWSREAKLTPDDLDMLVVARKPRDINC